MKVKRFIKEFANYKIENIEQNELMQKQIKDEKTKHIIKVLCLCEKGLLTIDEAITTIASV